jgi:hypothetical protein
MPVIRRNGGIAGYISPSSNVLFVAGQSNAAAGNFDTNGQSLAANLGSGAHQGWLYPLTAGVDTGLKIFVPFQETVNYSVGINTPAWLTGSSDGYWDFLYNGWNNLNCTYQAPPAFPTTSSSHYQNWAAEAQFSWMYRQEHPKSPLYILRYVISGTQLGTNAGGLDWNSGSSGKLFDGMVDIWSKASAKLTNPRVLAFLWIQGENDAGNSTLANAYQTNLGNFISAVRSRIDSNRQTKFIIARLNNAKGQWSQGATVQAAQDAYASAAFCKVVNSDSYPLQGDNVHYTEVGQTCSVGTQGVMPASGGLGSDMYNAWKAL